MGFDTAFLSKTVRCRKCRSIIVATEKMPRDVTANYGKRGIAGYYCDNCNPLKKDLLNNKPK